MNDLRFSIAERNCRAVQNFVYGPNMPKSSPMVSLCCEIFLLCAGATVFHCRSPFYLCFEHVDNLGAYTASLPETGLHLIWLQQCVWWSARERDRLTWV